MNIHHQLIIDVHVIDNNKILIYFNEPLKKLPDDTIKYYRLTYGFGTGIYPELYSVYSSPYELKLSNDVKNYLCINMSTH